MRDRLLSALTQLPDALAKDLSPILRRPEFDASLSANEMATLCQNHQMNEADMALALLPLAAAYAMPAISQFYVGAIAKGGSGHFYFGANLEFAHVSLAHTVHAEQSAISHAWLRGETTLSAIYINYSPCGHCRQFINELNGAEQITITLPKQPTRAFHDYLPDAFGPSDLNISEPLLAPKDNALTPEMTAAHPLYEAALAAANQSHAPYSHNYAGIACLLDNGQIFTGRYAENAAFKPKLAAVTSRAEFNQLGRLLVASD